jgi:uncharacterized protein YpuA (DUF1002 family)
MQRMFNISMKVVCNTSELLEKVKQNKDAHIAIVEEAKRGFAKKAQEVLENHLEKLKRGLLKDLRVSLTPPRDHTREYETIIKMLQLHKNTHIELNADEVRMFVEDRWDWTEDFLQTNSAYSILALSKREHD